jgi:hypothetical protein
MREATVNVDVFKGRSYPLAATVTENGVNVSLYLRNTSGVALHFFD